VAHERREPTNGLDERRTAIFRPMTALQDLYPADFSHCYGCGRLNTTGLHVKSEWTDGEAIARFRPAPYHMALPGFVYGGLIASLVDCHAMATAAAAWMVATGLEPGRDETPRFVTASLSVDFLHPTPLGPELRLRARPIERGERKIVVVVGLLAEDVECATARVVAVRAPSSMLRAAPGRERLERERRGDGLPVD
jgi:acyl-coenzyme A thioesterase PaaI-like protein